MNKVILIGRLTKDPELRYTPGNGTAVTTLTLAIDNYNSKTGEKSADFIPVVIWGKQAENTAQSAMEESSQGKICTLNCPLDELAILNLIVDNPNITQKEIANRIGKSERTVKNKIASLKDKGYIQRLNGKRNGKWKVIMELFR